MGKRTFAAVATIPLLLLGYCRLPSTSCDAVWFDAGGRPIAAPVDACRHTPRTRLVGGQAFARIGAHVYQVDKSETRKPGGAVCMTGVTCFPLYERARKDTYWRLARLDGPVDLARLRAYLDDRILSDGSAVFDGLQRLAPLRPALDLARLRPAVAGALGPTYATDGRWVLHHGQVLAGADPSTLEAVPLAFVAAGPGDSVPDLGNVVRDRHAVFFGHQPITGADPTTFVRVHYDRARLYPGAGLPDTGWIGLDRRSAWYLPDSAAEPRALDTQRYWTLRQELARIQRDQQLEPFDPPPARVPTG